METPFWGPVVVAYTAGIEDVSPDIRLAVLEDIRGLFQQTQQGMRPPAFGGGGGPGGGDTWTVGPMRQFPRLAALLEGAGRTQSIA